MHHLQKSETRPYAITFQFQYKGKLLQPIRLGQPNPSLRLVSLMWLTESNPNVGTCQPQTQHCQPHLLGLPAHYK